MLLPASRPTPRDVRRRRRIRDLLAQHRKLIRPDIRPLLTLTVVRLLHPLHRPREEQRERNTAQEHGNRNVDVLQRGQSDGGDAPDRGQVGDGEEEGGDDGEELSIFRLRGIGDVEFELDQVVEALFEGVEFVFDLAEVFDRVADFGPYRVGAFSLGKVFADVVFQLAQLLERAEMEVEVGHEVVHAVDVFVHAASSIFDWKAFTFGIVTLDSHYSWFS